MLKSFKVISYKWWNMYCTESTNVIDPIIITSSSIHVQTNFKNYEEKTYIIVVQCSSSLFRREAGIAMHTGIMKKYTQCMYR